MATVILVRHGRTTANASGVLAGRTAGVSLDDVGRAQAARTAERLAVVPLVGVVSSPLERCQQTAQFIVDLQRAQQSDQQPGALPGAQVGAQMSSIEDDITECDYGQWQGRSLAELGLEDLWSVVQRQPSAVVFPGGESMVAMQARSVSAIRRLDAAFEAEHGPSAVWVAVSHGDIIKAILADALGMHIDLFQRINVNPASASIVRYRSAHPDVISTNTDAGDLSWLRKTPDTAEPQVGGGAGHQEPDNSRS